MKKYVVLLMMVLLVMGLVGCGSNSGGNVVNNSIEDEFTKENCVYISIYNANVDNPELSDCDYHVYNNDTMNVDTKGTGFFSTEQRYELFDMLDVNNLEKYEEDMFFDSYTPRIVISYEVHHERYYCSYALPSNIGEITSWLDDVSKAYVVEVPVEVPTETPTEKPRDTVFTEYIKENAFLEIYCGKSLDDYDVKYVLEKGTGKYESDRFYVHVYTSDSDRKPVASTLTIKDNVLSDFYAKLDLDNAAVFNVDAEFESGFMVSVPDCETNTRKYYVAAPATKDVVSKLESYMVSHDGREQYLIKEKVLKQYCNITIAKQDGKKSIVYEILKLNENDCRIRKMRKGFASDINWNDITETTNIYIAEGSYYNNGGKDLVFDISKFDSILEKLGLNDIEDGCVPAYEKYQLTRVVDDNGQVSYENCAEYLLSLEYTRDNYGVSSEDLFIGNDAVKELVKELDALFE